MSIQEIEVQRVMTGAVDRYIELLSKDGLIKYKCTTRANRSQSTYDPEHLGVDVLGILDAKKILAFELKKTTHGSTPSLPAVDKNQLDFLIEIQKASTIESYVVFDTIEDFEGTSHTGSLRAIGQLASLAAIPPNWASEKKIIKTFACQQSPASTVLDVFSRSLARNTADTDGAADLLLELMQKKVYHINNCFLWFIANESVLGLTQDEVQSIVNQLLDIKSLPEGMALVLAWRNYRNARKPATMQNEESQALLCEAYMQARSNFLTAVCAPSMESYTPSGPK